MTVLQGVLESGAPAPGGGGEQISMIWARTRPWPAQFLCAPNRQGECGWCSWRGFPDGDLAGA